MSQIDLEPPQLEIRGVEKSFGGIRVLEGISVSFQAGEVHAVMGENGAGKSTLMKVLAGEHEPDNGGIWLNGREVRFRDPHTALRCGIAMIYQELLPVPEMTVAENIFLGREPASRVLGWVRRRAMNGEAEGLLGELGARFSPGLRMRDLSVPEMQVVEIARALAHRARIIIMDEPTSALSGRESESLFRIVAELRGRGVTVIYISHKMEEVFRLADRITVLRDGRLVTTRRVGELQPDQVVGLMVGREWGLAAERERAYSNLVSAEGGMWGRSGGGAADNPLTVPVGKGLSPRLSARAEAGAGVGEVALSVEGLGKAGRFQGVSFEVRRGEVLGMAGLMGAGRTDVVSAIYGLEPADTGEIRVRGRAIRMRRPGDALAAGIGLVTEDRKTHGLVPAMGAGPNITLAALRRFCQWGCINHGAERRVVAEQRRVFAIKMTGPDQPVLRLSGGNQQKVVLARALLTEPAILLLDEPTRGIDVAAKAEVHALIRRLADEGRAVVLVSSEMPELLRLSDRLLVMRQGRVVGEMAARGATREEVLRLAMGMGMADPPSPA